MKRIEMSSFSTQYENASRIVLGEVREAIGRIDLKDLERFKEDLLNSNRVFFIGVGRVMLSLEAMAKRLSHLGLQCCCVGDITEPAITPHDILVVGSGSGVSIVPLAIAQKAKELGARVVHIGSNPNSRMQEFSDYMVRIPTRTRLYLENEIESRQIMTSLFEQTLFLLGDILALMIVNERNIEVKELWKYHANLE